MPLFIVKITWILNWLKRVNWLKSYKTIGCNLLFCNARGF